MGVVEKSRQPHARRQCRAIHPFEAVGCGCDQPLERRQGRWDRSSLESESLSTQLLFESRRTR